MQKPKFANNEIYHILNRGVEKRTIFLDDRDKLRFIQSLDEFNSEIAATNLGRRSNLFEVELRTNFLVNSVVAENSPKNKLVEILAFCLMPNHYHLMARQLVDGGIIKFMQKIGTGFTNYFNKKHERVGHLFQGRFKAVLVDRESQFSYLPFYIHLNPLDLIMPEWREGKLKDHKKAFDFLINYRWSSFLDYIGVLNFPRIVKKESLLDFFGDTKTYKSETQKWLLDMNISGINDILLE